MATEQIQTIIFDLDGTLYPMTKRFKPLFALFSLPHPLRLPKYMKLRDKFRGEARESGDAIMGEINVAIENEFGISSGSDWQEREFYPAFFSALKTQPKRPGVNKLLAELKEKGYRLVVLSDFGKVRERLSALSIDTAPFELLLSSEELGGFKPNKLPFEKTVEKLGLPVESILMVGDRDETDGEGAEKVGMPFLKVPGKTNEGWNEAILPLKELPQL
jgi:HAD superfamily hydrolase (TIGR01549 family)